MTAAIATPKDFQDFTGSYDSIDKLQAALGDGSFAKAVEDYVNSQHKVMDELNTTIKAEAQIVLAKMLDEAGADKGAAKRLNLNPQDSRERAGYRPIHNPAAVGAGIDGVFSSLDEFTKAIWHKGTPTAEVQAKLDKVKAYQERVPADGGFLVPEEFRAELLRTALESAVVRPRARVVPMGSSTLKFPAVDETTHATSLFGGVVVYRTEEGAELTESGGKFRSIKLEATKQTALAKVTNELVRDAAGGFAMYISEIFPEAIAFYEDLDFISGGGVGEPLGALNSGNTSLVSVAKESGQAAATIGWENVVKMYARMLPSSLNRAVWLVGPDAFPELATMGLVVGTGGGPIWISDGTEAPRMTILGRPVIVTEKAPAALGTLGDISFVDLGYYLIGDRQTMTMDASEHAAFTSDRTVYRVIQRNDGRPWVESALTPANGGATLSPFVQLATRS